ncbi:MAG: SNF2-related protein [Blastocatellia bacterium]|nr:SNF2-related protein [Blastocatellia bacterium]
MKRKISAETRRKLRELAMSRWARHEKSRRELHEEASPSPPDLRALAVAIDLGAMRRTAGAGIAKRGAALFARKRDLRIEGLTEESARVRVVDDSPYRVRFTLLDGEVVSNCDCPFGRITAEVVCKHKIAAAMLLREKYAPEAPANGKPKAESKWREELAMILRPEARPARQGLAKGILFFSFVERNGRQMAQPGFVSTSVIPESIWQDRAALSELLLRNWNNPAYYLSAYELQAREMDSRRWVNATPCSQALMQLAFERLQASPIGYADSTRPPFWDALAGELVFRGRGDRLIREAAEVLPGLAQVEVEMERADGGVRLSLVAAFPDRAIRLGSRDQEVFHHHPLWLRDGSRIFRVDLHLSQYNQLRRQAEVIVPPDSLDEFYSRKFSEVAGAYSLRGEAARTETLSGAVPQPRVYLTEENHELQISLRFSYNGLECLSERKPPAFSYVHDAERNLAVRITRQIERETEWWQRLGGDEFGLKAGALRDGTAQETFLLRKGMHPYDFLKNRAPLLAAAGVEIYGESDLSARINQAKPHITFEITSEIDWFDLKAIAHWGEQMVPLAEIRKALRRNERFIKLADGTIGEIPEDWLEKYKHLFGLSEAREEGLRVARHHVALLDHLFGDSEHVKADKRFEGARAWLKNFEGIQPQALPRAFAGELRPYQKAGFDWLHFLREARFGGCLADDMGTGKTIQTLCFLQSLKESYAARNERRRRKEPRSAHLLIVPRSLVTNWQREAAKFASELRILDFAHTDRAAETGEFDQYDVVLTTYGILLREIERLREYEFDTVILDEAQAIKNPVSESAKAARQLACRHRLTLTGTPVENNTLELWSQFAFLNPGLLGSADYFREEFMGPIERQKDEGTTRTLKRLVYPFILRRTKDQVALDLPPRTEKILWGEMEPAQRALYIETRDKYRALLLKLIEEGGVRQARFRILEGLLRLRQICNHPRLVRPTHKGGSAKMEALLDTLKTAQAEGHKTLVFSQFVQMLKLVEKELRKARIPYAYLDGSTTNRQARVDQFQNDEGIRVFLLSLKAGGVGLNLTAADYVVHVDPWWNPAVEMQASDRAHRIGQDKPVFVYKLMMRDSVEEKILQLQDRKRDLVKQLITTETGFIKSLTAEDIQGLFS